MVGPHQLLPLFLFALLFVVQTPACWGSRSDRSNSSQLVDRELETSFIGQDAKVRSLAGVDPDAAIQELIDQNEALGNQNVVAPLKKLQRLIGLSEVKERVIQLVLSLRFEKNREILGLKPLGAMSKHMLFLGNPGTGKTVVARIVGELLVNMGVIKTPPEVAGEEDEDESSNKKGGRGAKKDNKKKKKKKETNVSQISTCQSKDGIKFCEASRADLVAEYTGQTAPKVKSAVAAAFGGVLFIDEAYALAQKGDNFGQEAVDTLIKEMEDHREHVVIILAGYKNEMMQFLSTNPGFKSRVPFSFLFEDYTCNQLVNIGELTLMKKKVFLGFKEASTPLDGYDGFLCEPNSALPGCKWLKSVTKYATGCCEEGEECPQTKDNGNGRAVRNVIEATFRYIAGRVIPGVDVDALEEFVAATKKTPPGDLRCLGKTDDVRCDFALMKDVDLAMALNVYMVEDFKSGCDGVFSLMPQHLLKQSDDQRLALIQAFSALKTRAGDSKIQEQKCATAKSLMASASKASLAEVGEHRALEGAEESIDEGARAAIVPRNGGKKDISPARPEESAKARRARADKVMQRLNDDFIGLKDVKDSMVQLKNMVEFDIWHKQLIDPETSLMGQSFHMKFLGNPGTGKTVVARLVGELLKELGVIKEPPVGAKGACPEAMDRNAENGHGGDDGVTFREVSRADLVAEFVGQTAPKVKTAVCRAFGGVLFIDEAYSLVKTGGDSFGQEAVDTLIKEMEDHHEYVIVILAGYEAEMETFIDSNPGFKSRVPISFHFNDYSCEELTQIGQLMLHGKSMKLAEGVDAALQRAIQVSTGCCLEADMENCVSSRDNGNGRSVRNIIEGSYRFLASRALRDAEKVGRIQELKEDAAKNLKLAKNKDSGKVKSVNYYIKQKLFTPPCEIAKNKDVCDHLRQVEAIDINSVLEENIFLNLHQLCVPLEGQVTKVALSDIRRKVRAIPLLTNEERAKVVSARDCEQGLSILEQGVARVKPGSKMLDEPLDLPMDQAPCSVREVFAELDKLVGLTKVKRVMKELYALVRFSQLREDLYLGSIAEQSFHMKFVGNPGTGKTVVARLVGEMLLEMGAVKSKESPHVSRRCLDPEKVDPEAPLPKLNFHEGSRSDLVGEHVGDTALKTIRTVKEALGGVLFIDEAYSIVQAGGKDSFGMEAVDTLIKEMEDKRKEIIVILAGYEKEMDKFFESNPGFKSRVPITFHFDDYMCDDLLAIGRFSLNKIQYTLKREDEPGLAHLINFASGCCHEEMGCRISRDNGNGRTVRNVVEAVVRTQTERLSEMPNFSELSKEEMGALAQSDLELVAAELANNLLGRMCAKDGTVTLVGDSLKQHLFKKLYAKHLPVKALVNVIRKVNLGSIELLPMIGGRGNSTSDLNQRILSCSGRIQEFQKALSTEVSSVCSTDHGMNKTAKEISSSSTPVELTPELARKVAKDSGLASALENLVSSLEGYGVDDELKTIKSATSPLCQDCLQSCKAARSKLDTTTVQMKVDLLLDFLAS